MAVYTENPVESTWKEPQLKSVSLAWLQDTDPIYKNPFYFCMLAMNNWKLKFKRKH